VFWSHLPFRRVLDGIQLADTAQGLGRDRAPIRLMEVEELPPGMGQTGEFDHLATKQRLVAGELIDHQRALPVPEELRHILPAAARLVVEDDNRRIACQGIAAIRPEIGPLGLSSARVELLHRRFIGMQHRPLAEPFGETQPERFQGDADAADPVGQRRTGQGHPRACGLPFETVEGEMIGVLADHHPGQQGRCRQTAVDD